MSLSSTKRIVAGGGADMRNSLSGQERRRPVGESLRRATGPGNPACKPCVRAEFARRSDPARASGSQVILSIREHEGNAYFCTASEGPEDRLDGSRGTEDA